MPGQKYVVPEYLLDPDFLAKLKNHADAVEALHKANGELTKKAVKKPAEPKEDNSKKKLDWYK